ncbi:hypothetical protein [Jannaschia sp. 2305UL9-9]
MFKRIMVPADGMASHGPNVTEHIRATDGGRLAEDAKWLVMLPRA